MRNFVKRFARKNKGRRYYHKMSNEDLLDLFQLMMIDPRHKLSVRKKVAELLQECESNDNIKQSANP